jgi:hypothetical protein
LLALELVLYRSDLFALKIYSRLIDWLFTILRSAQFFTYMETSPLPVKGCKIWPMLGAQGLWAGRDLYRVTPTVTRYLSFSGLLPLHSVASYDTHVDAEDPRGAKNFLSKIIQECKSLKINYEFL